MINIFVEPIGITIKMEKGKTLHQGLEESGISIEQPCGGMGSCGACRIWVSGKNIPSTPHEDITEEEDKKGLRLACRSIPEGDATIRLEDNFVYDKMELDQGRILLQNNKSIAFKIEPAVKITKEKNVFQLWHDKALEPVILDDWKPEFTPKGLAIDIGTTTMVLSLISLETGEILASGSSLNPQVVHGHDVLTRVNYAKTPEKIDEMALLVQNKLNSLLGAACKDSHTLPEEIIDVAIGANTTMLQMAAGIDSAPIGRSPFNFDIKGGTSHKANLFGLNVNKAAKVYLPPIMHAFVGTDISAGLTLCPDFFDDDKSILFIDMGTNGEICLNVNGKRYTTSTAAGPAFEGMGLSTGMRATDGAVEKAECINGIIHCQTIGNKKVKGICGSGIVDLIVALRKSGYLDTSGRFSKKDMPDSQVVDFKDNIAFQYGDDIYLTQKDIRQIQLAKGAVRTGIDLILKTAGIDATDLHKIYVAGGFGNYLQPINMERLGLFPENSADKIVFCGNASVDGSTVLVTNGGQRRFLENALNSMEHLQLAESPLFMDCFLKSLSFP